MVKVSSDIIWPKIGNDRVIDFLDRSLKSDKVGQTYVFVGAGGLGKTTVSLAFARNLLITDTKKPLQENFNDDKFLNINTDIQVLKVLEKKKDISVDQIRDFIKTLSLSSFFDSYKIGIIKEGDNLNENGQNLLLKTLEEPREKVVIIILVSDEKNLSKTILSRSQILYFHPVPVNVIYDYLIDNYEVNRSLARDLANLSLGRPLKAIAWLEDKEKYEEYLDKSKLFLSAFSLDVNGRIKVSQEIFKNNSLGKSAAEKGNSIIDIVEGLLRDLLLLSLGQKKKIQHVVLINELEEAMLVLERHNLSDATLQISKKIKNIIQVRDYLKANVYLQSAFEKFMINLI